MPTHRDLAPERQERLRERIRAGGFARVDELSRALGVSVATVRRDLEALDRRGWVQRIHGGAMLAERRLEEPGFDAKTGIATNEKRAIARRAFALVEKGMTVFLDGGSTILELARLLAPRGDVTVVTNSLRAASELAGAEPRLIVVGGELRRRSQTLVGPLARGMIAGLHVDLAFMGTIGVTARDGMTTTDPAEAFTKEGIMAHASTVVLLAHSGKIGKVSFARTAGLDDVDVLITDARLPREFEAAARRADVRIVKV